MGYKSTAECIKALEKLREQQKTCLVSGTMDLWNRQFNTCYQYMIKKVENLCCKVIRANQKSHLYFSIHINNVAHVEFSIHDSDKITRLYSIDWNSIPIKPEKYIAGFYSDVSSDLINVLMTLDGIDTAIKQHLKINEKERPTPVDSASDNFVF